MDKILSRGSSGRYYIPPCNKWRHEKESENSWITYCVKEQAKTDFNFDKPSIVFFIAILLVVVFVFSRKDSF